MSAHDPVLIVGGGLAGMAMGWRLWQKGVRFLVVDPDVSGTSSKIAAGLITPITGLRLTVSPGFAEHLAAAREFYRRIGRELGKDFYREVPHVRLFKDEREVEHWMRRADGTGFQEWLDPSSPRPLVDEQVFRGELGGIQMRGSGWLDAAGYLAASRNFFEALGQWRTGMVEEAALEAGMQGVKWQGDVYGMVVLCRGAEERNETRFFPWLPWQCARGVIATVKADVKEERIVARNCWLLPRAEGWRAGSTYDWDFREPIEPSVEALRGKVAALLKVPFEMVDAQAGIRPILKSRVAALGRHPAHPRVALFNGLGSKGALQAPFYSRVLADHLMDGAPLDKGVDVAANG